MKTYRSGFGRIVLLVAVLILLSCQGFCETSPDKIRVGYFSDKRGFIYKGQDGQYKGYGIEYLREIAKYTDWTYEFVYGTWEECTQRLKTGEIDLLGTVQYTAERAALYGYPANSCGIEYASMYVRKENQTIYYEDFSAFTGLKVGFVKGAYQRILFQEYAQKHHIQVTEKEYDSRENLMRALDSYEIDAMVQGSMDDIATENERVIANFGSMPFYLITGKDNSAVLKPLDDAIEKIKIDKPYLDLHLYERYYAETAALDQLRFTKQEADFIKRCPVLKIACDPQAIPMQYFDSASAMYRGVYVDLLTLILSRGGLAAEFVPTSSIEESMELVRDGKADILASAYAETSFGRMYNLVFTKPYVQVRSTIAGRQGAEFDAGKRATVAVLKHHPAMQYFLQARYPDWTIHTYENLAACIEAVQSGAADICMEHAETLLPFLQRNRYDDIRTLLTLEDDLPVSIGISNQLAPELLSVLNKAINSISRKEIMDIIFANTMNYPQILTLREMCEQNAGLIFCVLTIAIFLIAYTFIHVNRRKKQELTKLAYEDRLTGIRNFEKFELDATQVLHRSDPASYVLVYMDIEKFKYINESLGYAKGNEVLIAFASLFHRALREDELVARVSGDRFVALLRCRVEGNVAKHIYELYEKFRSIRTTVLENQRFVLVSGIYHLHSTDRDINIAVDRANLARKTIKGSHQNSLAFYDEKIHHQAIIEKEIENTMEQALANQEFIVYLQPKYKLKDRSIIGAEALVRWIRADGTMILPDAFIPVFERNGFIADMDFYVFDLICGLLRQWLELDRTIFPIAVNFSRMHMNQPDFIEKLTAVTKRNKISPCYLEIEMTESAFVDTDIDAAALAVKMKNAGFLISMDDFGTGYSSLNLLREVPFDVLKLDKSFMKSREGTRRERILISNIVRMAKELDIRVVAEGVETEAQEKFLTEIFCDMAQGFLFARPMSIADFEKLLWENS